MLQMLTSAPYLTKRRQLTSPRTIRTSGTLPANDVSMISTGILIILPRTRICALTIIGTGEPNGASTQSMDR